MAHTPSPPHVAVVVFPVASHASMLLWLAHALAAVAPATSVSFLSTADALSQLSNSVVVATALRGNLCFVEIEDGLPTTEGAGEEIHRRIEMFMAASEAGGLEKGLEAACAAAGGDRVSCVVGDAFVWMAADAATAAGVPWVPVWPSSASVLVAHLRTDELREDIGDQAANRADELLTSYAGLGSYRVKDLPEGVVSGDFNFVISLLLHRMAQRLPRDATAIAVNTFPGLDQPDVTAALAAALPNCLPIGPCHLLLGNDVDAKLADDAHGCLPWLDRHLPRTVAYVAFGTVAALSAEELHELAAGLEAGGAPFLWSLRDDLRPSLPPGFLDRTLVVPWAPQVEVLLHASVGAFLSHGGWASVLEAVGSGVPMACRPFFGDHRMNARSVAHVLGCGTAFEGPMTRGAVAGTMAALLHGEDEGGGAAGEAGRGG